jgi:hypothetical protein
MYRQLAEQTDDPFVKNEMLELASVCDEVANNIEYHLTGVAPWEASIADADGLLQTQRLSRLQRSVLAADNERKRQLIAPLKEIQS